MTANQAFTSGGILVKMKRATLEECCPEERKLALAAGANDIWSKPFDFDVFRKSVGELLKDKPV